ncbi:SDR family NAD(P)-dependent oxidoreductase [Auraticoccus sp. F435]|uniref:SDR family NAD(P)-dependent oxidoreductase n=1 Tax=Auraticoccus cholistanensis TaxID=2656650 RepID=A0A6A9UUA6_9ACTN|nr:SDR family NAD(P)-dependent oxidoreductase [Auraticoccus cholistanensis]MVA76261.1 SDR family NAD(P)-dependent oxidoreductase [Auraticoccus cholistanensis]
MPAHAVVVGASSTIGAAIARRVAAHVDVVHLWGRDEVRLAEAADGCRPLATALTHRVDVRDAEQVGAALQQVPAEEPLRTVVWAAGLFDWGATDTADPVRWQQLLDTNLTAAAVLTARVGPALVRSAPSSLVFIGSGAASQAYPDNAAYVASKHGLAGLSRAVFLDLRDRDVKVSLVSPGLVAAGAGLLSPQGQARPDSLIQPEDVADAVEFVLTSPPHVCPTEIRLAPQRS